MNDAIILTGTLAFAADGALVRTVETPNYEKTVIRGGQVRLWQRRDGIGRTGSLADYPLLQGLVHALRGVLSGHAGTLERRFRIRFHGPAGHGRAWRLHLVPREPKVARRLASITVAGEGQRIGHMLLIRPGGNGGNWIRIDFLP